MMGNSIRLYPKDIKEGMRFSAPVFFDDGVNMFLAAGKSVKPYHLYVLKRWNILSLVTYGHEISMDSKFEDVSEVEPIEDLEAFDEEDLSGTVVDSSGTVHTV